MIARTEKVSKIFQERSLPVAALSGVDVSIGEGEFVAVAGSSGSGKTTLLNLLGGLDKATEGKVYVDGEDLGGLSASALSSFRQSRIGFIFQDYNLIPNLTVAENVEYILWLRRVSGAERRKKSQEICDRFGIGKLMSRKPSELSRGQQQRTAIARAVIHRPKLILGDEMTANLDQKTGASLMDFLRELNEKEKITIVYSTHDPVMIERAKRVIRLQDGKIQN